MTDYEDLKPEENVELPVGTTVAGVRLESTKMNTENKCNEVGLQELFVVLMVQRI